MKQMQQCTVYFILFFIMISLWVSMAIHKMRHVLKYLDILVSEYMQESTRGPVTCCRENIQPTQFVLGQKCGPRYFLSKLLEHTRRVLHDFFFFSSCFVVGRLRLIWVCVGGQYNDTTALLNIQTIYIRLFFICI